MADRVIYLRAEDEWAFGAIARSLSAASGVAVGDRVAESSYLLSDPGVDCPAVNPRPAILIANDKRLIEECFARYRVPRPATLLLDTAAEVAALVGDGSVPFIIKYPTACGSIGHQVVRGPFTPRRNWPLPFVVQEFITLAVPRVHRAYLVGGRLVGFNVRRFPEGRRSDLVAHALGARYFWDEPAPPEIAPLALLAATAVGLEHGFCAVDLLHADDGRWLVLEVGTDGIFNHVDRDFANAEFSDRLDAELAGLLA